MVRVIRIKDRTEETPCVHCGGAATRFNPSKQPVCKKHAHLTPKEIHCPECGFPMDVKQGKYGYFWGCRGFPGCDKTFSIYSAMQIEE